MLRYSLQDHVFLFILRSMSSVLLSSGFDQRVIHTIGEQHSRTLVYRFVGALEKAALQSGGDVSCKTSLFVQNVWRNPPRLDLSENANAFFEANHVGLLRLRASRLKGERKNANFLSTVTRLPAPEAFSAPY
jgi:hypothetical protein